MIKVVPREKADPRKWLVWVHTEVGELGPYWFTTPPEIGHRVLLEDCVVDGPVIRVELYPPFDWQGVGAADLSPRAVLFV